MGTCVSSQSCHDRKANNGVIGPELGLHENTAAKTLPRKNT